MRRFSKPGGGPDSRFAGYPHTIHRRPAWLFSLPPCASCESKPPLHSRFFSQLLGQFRRSGEWWCPSSWFRGGEAGLSKLCVLAQLGEFKPSRTHRHWGPSGAFLGYIPYGAASSARVFRKGKSRRGTGRRERFRAGLLQISQKLA